MDYTNVKPYDDDNATKTEQLSRMFNTISGKYDKFNNLMSWGMARVWRKKALKSLQIYDPKYILDIATGTGDMCVKCFEYLRPYYIAGVDISEQMLELAREKVYKEQLADCIHFEIQDSAALTYPDACFDAVTIAFGIRNFEKLNQSLQQIHRVLKPAGHLMILEMNEPRKGFLLWAYKLYIRVFVRMTSRIYSEDSRAYEYLTLSMRAFPSGEKLMDILKTNGFSIKKYRNFTFGVCSMYLAEKE